MLITAWPAGMILVAPLAGRLVDRVSAETVSSGGLVLLGVAFAFTAFIGPGNSDVSIVIRLLIAGIGFGLFVSPNNRALMLAAPSHRSPGASAALSLARVLGQTRGAIAVAFIFVHVGRDTSRICLLCGALTAWTAALLSGSRLLPGFTRMEKKENQCPI